MDAARLHPYLTMIASMWRQGRPAYSGQPPGGWEAFSRYLERAKMAGFFHAKIIEERAEPTFPASFVQGLERFRFHVMAQSSRLEEATAEVCSAVKSSGHKAVPLKGLWLNRRIYGDASLRRTTDGDILVPPSAIAPLSEFMLSRGYRVMPPEHKVVWQTVYKKEGSFPFEAHVLLSSPDENPPPSGEILERAGAWGEENEGLELADALIYLSVNNARDNLVLFPGNLHDIAIIAGRLSASEWTGVAERSQRWMWRAGVWLNLACANDLFGSPVPASVMKELKPASWRTHCAWAALRWYRGADMEVNNLPRGMGSLYKASVIEDVSPIGYVMRRRALALR